jgi:hypothetical protein
MAQPRQTGLFGCSQLCFTKIAKVGVLKMLSNFVFFVLS